MLLVLIPQALFEGVLHILLIHLDHFLIHLVADFLEDFLHLRLIQPAHHILTDLILRLDPLEHFVESHIELVKLGLRLHQDHPCHVIEFRQAAVAQSLIQRILQRQPFA